MTATGRRSSTATLYLAEEGLGVFSILMVPTPQVCSPSGFVPTLKNLEATSMVRVLNR